MLPLSQSFIKNVANTSRVQPCVRGVNNENQVTMLIILRGDQQFPRYQSPYIIKMYVKRLTPEYER